MTNIIQLVRFAFHQIERLDSVFATAQQYFNLWCGQRNNEKTQKQIEVMRQIVDYVASNGTVTIKDIQKNDRTKAAQIIQAFGGLEPATNALLSLYKFVVYRKTA